MIRNRYFDTDENLQDEIVQLIIDRKLIPIIGSGFTRGCKAKNGTVPSGEDMEDYIKDVLSNAYQKNKSSFDKDSFPDLCTKYDKRVSNDDKFNYFSNNFTEVELSTVKKEFLSINWPYLYTLNIDDAIERNCTKYQVILPRKEYYQRYVEEYDIVFKVHGDIKHYLSYIEEEELIFNKKQYIESLKGNKKILAKFEEDFSINNLIYIGCSLKDEPDLLSVIRSVVNSGIKRHKETYYLSSSPLDEEASDILEDFGVSTCIVVQNYDVFYKKIIEKTAAHPIITEEILNQFREIDLIRLKPEESNLDFMLKSDNLVPAAFQNKLYLPHFFISRTVTQNILTSLQSFSPIHFIYGHRISGKTYCLIDIYEHIRDKQRYFFPSNTQITEKIMDSMLNKENSIFIFDTQCLSIQQLHRIISVREKLRKQDCFIVITINSSDRYSVDLLAESTEYKATLIKNCFDNDETEEINSIFEATNMPLFGFVEPYYDKVRNRLVKRYFTLLDNLYKIAIKFGESNSKYSLPDLSNINNGKDFAIIILLATQQEISSYDMYYYNISQECANFAVDFPTISEWVHVDKILSRSDAKQKLISNTRYYLLKILGDYSANPNKHKIIIEAYKYLFTAISHAENDKFQTSRKMLDFIKFDVINDVFYRKNNSAVVLIKLIYEEMETDMNINPQFKHQRAKSILWLNGNELLEIQKAVEYINLAYYNTETNYKRTNNTYLNISLGHISYTRAILYGRLCNLEKYSSEVNMKLAIEYYDVALFNPVNAVELKSLRAKRTDKRVYEDLNQLISSVHNSALTDEELKDNAYCLYYKLACFD